MKWWVSVILLVILVRAFWWMGVDGKRYDNLASGNRIIERRVRGERGLIYDRKGKVLVENYWADKSEMWGRREVEIKEVKRKYLEGEIAAHLIGYISDGVGQIGVEKKYQEELVGKEGREMLEVDAWRDPVQVLGKVEPVAGKEITLSLDIGLQRKIYDMMHDRKGAVVALDPVSFELLAMVSVPSFNPEKVEDYLTDDENVPLLNRGMAGEYAPGSVFKLVTAVAGLMEDKIDQSTRVNDVGEIRLGEWRFGNWYFDQYGEVEGEISLERAIARSNDIYFYKVGEWVGAGKLADWASDFGLGELTGVGLAGEGKGLVPEPFWKERNLGEYWYLGNTYHFAIGQGDLRATPLQVARMTAAMVNGGRLCEVVLRPEEVGECDQLEIDREKLESIVRGMRQVCQSGGTAYPFFGFEPAMVGKTGTSQQGGEEDLPHAWMMVSGPYDDERKEMKLDDPKRILLLVMLEAAGEGSREAAPIAKEILDWWFRN
jgi:penicillin-binding protein 2